MTKRTLSAVVVATILMAPALAQAKSTSVNFKYGADRAAWFWKNQQEVTVGEDPQLPGGVVAQERIDPPQSPDTLPIAVQNGELEKVSTILFDLAGRGVTAGSSITKMVITLTEGSDQNEQPSFNAGGKKVQACAVNEFWPAGQAELWSQRPKHDDKACAEGKRSEKGGTATWKFDLTSLAADWGETPSAYNGVALVPVVSEGGPSATWQLNLKIPNRDEYKQTKKRATMKVEFTPGAESTFDQAPTSFDSPTSFPSSSGSFSSGSSSGFPSSSSATTPSTSTGTETDAAPVANTAAPGETVPELPGYVWLLLPLGLLALAAVRSVILEPVGGPRPDGVIAAIRRRNAERRGVKLDTPVDPFTQAAAAMRSGVRRVATLPGKAWGAVKSIGRKS